MSSNINQSSIVRKCDICFTEVEASYKGYVIHVLQNHNPNAAQEFIPDKYVLECVLNGNVITKKNCDLCNTPISLDVYDYIVHIQKNHLNMINKSLSKYIQDKYVVSVLLNKNLYSQSSNIVICNSCGEEVDMEEFREHMIEHKKMKQFSKGFYGNSNRIVNQPLSNHQLFAPRFQQNLEQGKPSKSDNKTTNIPFNNPCHLPKTLNANNGNNPLKNSCFNQQPQSYNNTNSYDKKNSVFGNFNNSSSAPQNPSKPNAPQGPPQKSNVSSSSQYPQNNFNLNNMINHPDNLSNQKQSQDLNMLTNLIDMMKGNSININLNINSNNITNLNTSSNTVVTNNNISSSGNSEEIQKLKSQVLELKNKLETLEVQQSQTIEEHDKLQQFICEKMSESNFKMKDIEKEVMRISELEAKINDNITQIEELDKYKNEHEKRLKEQENKINSLEHDLKEKKEELQKQFDFLNSSNNNLFADKFNQVEKELNKVKLELLMKSNNDINFTKPSTWMSQNENLILVIVESNTSEYNHITNLFKQTMPTFKIRKLCRIQNLELWKNFCFSKHQLANKQNDKSMILFHGTCTADPREIYSGKEEGFDMRFSRDGYFGRGIYFHQRANYSHDYKYSSNGVHYMFVADVLVGEMAELKIDKSLRFPPFKDLTKKIRYDSVKADYDGIHVIYNNMRAYPSYLLEYED